MDIQGSEGILASVFFGGITFVLMLIVMFILSVSGVTITAPLALLVIIVPFIAAIIAYHAV